VRKLFNGNTIEFLIISVNVYQLGHRRPVKSEL